VRVWNKFPKSVKKKIAKYTKHRGFVEAIDRYIGAEEKIICKACRKVDIQKNAAKYVQGQLSY